jgi:hypothetical protein
MYSTLTKKQKKEMRALQALAWEMELEQELNKLEDQFRSWRSGTIGAFDLSDRIHQFHDYESRNLYKYYSCWNNLFAVPGAIAKGIISESEVSRQLLEAISSDIQYLREARNNQSQI